MNKYLIASVGLPGNHPQLLAKNQREEKLLWSIEKPDCVFTEGVETVQKVGYEAGHVA